MDGNELRWPGYLGRNYIEGRGILCVGAAYRESTLEVERRNPVIARTNADLIACAREWISAGRSEESDERYLDRLRNAHEDALPEWDRWRRHFRTLVEDYLGMSRSEIAWANLAKCLVSIDRGSKQRAAEGVLTRLCQREFPMSELVQAIRPAVVLVAVLHARPGGDIVRTWDAPGWSPLVFTWQGQSGHDRHNTKPGARRLSEWAPEMAARVRARQETISVPSVRPRNMT